MADVNQKLPQREAGIFKKIVVSVVIKDARTRMLVAAFICLGFDVSGLQIELWFLEAVQISIMMYCV